MTETNRKEFKRELPDLDIEKEVIAQLQYQKTEYSNRTYHIKQ